MPYKFKLLAALLSVTYTTAACAVQVAPSPTANPANLANPASIYCEEQGGRSEIRAEEGGGRFGMCLFVDGSECDEWAFYRQVCAPGQSLTPVPVGTATAAGSLAWLTYTDETLGFSFDYPQGSLLEMDALGRYLNVIGPLVNGEHWPWFGVAHPDEDDYQLPVASELESWLREHNRLPGALADSRAIGGETALHIRENHSAQAYNDDRYYFAHRGQIYEVIILHTGNEDWRVYNRFLDSIRFE